MQRRQRWAARSGRSDTVISPSTPDGIALHGEWRDDDSPPGAPAKTKRSKSLDLGDPIPFRLDASEKSVVEAKPPSGPQDMLLEFEDVSAPIPMQLEKAKHSKSSAVWITTLLALRQED